MSRSNWGLVIAIGIVALVATVIGVATWPRVPALQTYSYENPRTENYRAGGGECEPTAIAGIRDIIERARKSTSCEEKAEEYRLNTSDLIQQTRAADAAKAQADIASQGLWTAWFQTIGGFVTLAAAIGAAWYAREAARHTAASVDSAQKIAGPELVFSGRMYFDPLDEAESARLTIELRVLNAGGGIAQQFSVDKGEFNVGPYLFCHGHLHSQQLVKSVTLLPNGIPGDFEYTIVPQTTQKQLAIFDSLPGIFHIAWSYGDRFARREGTSFLHGTMSGQVICLSEDS